MKRLLILPFSLALGITLGLAMFFWTVAGTVKLLWEKP